MKPLFSATVIVLALALAGCANQKAPAEAALKAAQDSFSAVSAEAQKYVPDQAKAIQDGLDSAQAAITKGDYAAALTQAQALPAQIGALSSAIAAKKSELTAQWTTLGAGLPKLMDALKSRVEMLGKSKGLPAGISRDVVDNAKAAVSTATQAWTDATAAAQSGDMATAMAKASDVKATVVAAMTSLKMQVPAAAGGM